MNGFERINAALKGEASDKVPVMLHNFMMAAYEYGVSMEQFRNDPDIIAQCFIASVDSFNNFATQAKAYNIMKIPACRSALMI